MSICKVDMSLKFLSLKTVSPAGKLFKLMESLAIEKCHGTFEDSDYTGGLFQRDSGVPAHGR